MPVHQPPDREDDKDQPEYAADPDGSALTVITAAVEPKPTPKENEEQQDDQNQFHRLVFHQSCRQSTPGKVKVSKVWIVGRVASIDLQWG